MWNVLTWATASQQQAVVNAREATTECSRRAVERAEVASFLAAVLEARAETAATPPMTAVEQLAAVR